MSRRITPSTSIDNLKREAKRWLQALRVGDAGAGARFARAVTPVPPAPGLRQVQHALAREFGVAGWSDLIAAVAAARAEPVRIDAAALTRFLRAAADGDVDAVTLALGAHPAMVSARGMLRGHIGLRSALHFAVGGSHVDVVRLLLERGADPDVRDEGDNALPLHFAAEREELPIIRLLVEHGSDMIGAGDDHDLEVIGWATVFGSARPEVVEYLLAHGARHNIFSAIVTGNLAAIETIARADGAQLDRTMDRTNRRRRPLHLAVVKRQLGALDLLLRLGAPVDRRDAAGLTPLDQAALDGQRDMVDHLIAAGARIELPAAVALDRPDEVRRLHRDDPDVLHPGHRLGTLIVRAAERGSARVIDALIAGGADVNAEDDESTSVDGTFGYTALHAAAFAGNIAATKALLAHGARVAARDTVYAATPVGWAAYGKHDDVVKLLIESPIDIFDAIDQHRHDRIRELVVGDRSVLERPMHAYLRVPPREDWWFKGEWTPLAYAAALGHDDAIAVLEELGAAVPAEVVSRFLELACPDHHIRSASDHLRVRSAAMRLLADHPDLKRATFATAIVCGNLADVQRRLAAEPQLANAPIRHSVTRSAPGNVGDTERNLPAKEWASLLYLSFARLPLQESAENAIAIAQLLLDRGADPNAYFMAGDSRYTPLVGVIGEGEEDRPAHPRRDELSRLLLANGANQYDQQVGYNIGFKGKVLWFLQLAYARAMKLGLGRDWEDPAWMMLNMGNYGSGARWYLGIAVANDDVELARWCLEHGADANAEPPLAKMHPKASLYELAVRGGRDAIADLLIAHGAAHVPIALTNAQQLLGAALRHESTAARALVARHPDLRTDAFAIGEAVKRKDVDAVRTLIDAGVSVEAVDREGERPLHVAAWSNAVDVARLLVARGAEVDSIRGNYHNTALGAAQHFRLESMINYLSGVSRDIWELVYLGKIERVRELIAENPDLAQCRSATQTPLMWLPVDDEACAVDLATLLMANGADPRIVNHDGRTAADIAERNGMTRLGKLLRAGPAHGTAATAPGAEQPR
ncbi:MAG TPA: ankyrin repeat domain-containing protein [Gemmatimonadales bacterium]